MLDPSSHSSIQFKYPPKKTLHACKKHESYDHSSEECQCSSRRCFFWNMRQSIFPLVSFAVLYEKEAAAFQKVLGSSHLPRTCKEKSIYCVWLKLGKHDVQLPTVEMLTCKILCKQNWWDQFFGLFEFQNSGFFRTSDVNAIDVSSIRCNMVTCAVPH